jgi:hypothetical protein
LQCSFSPLIFHETIASNLPYILPNGGLCIHQFSNRIAEITRIPGKFISLDFLPGEYRLNVSIRGSSTRAALDEEFCYWFAWLK